MEVAGGLLGRLETAMLQVWIRMLTGYRRVARSDAGQGTTEYAILVGVLVVIAIIAITLFRGRLQELWTAIADGINSL